MQDHRHLGKQESYSVARKHACWRVELPCARSRIKPRSGARTVAHDASRGELNGKRQAPKERKSARYLSHIQAVLYNQTFAVSADSLRRDAACRISCSVRSAA